ncbi:MAG: BlaI/MecI/CopY family transcriptional regulator [bacterium]|nr:BlaI/MecI/CopY family transcriptional regulator [bacterium]
MARQQTPTLTETELRLMEVIWRKGEATVHQILEELPQKSAPAYNSVLTIVRIMEQKGYLTHIKNGRSYVYRPAIERSDVSRKAIRKVAKNFFNDSPQQLLLNIIKSEKLNADDLRELVKMIEEQE